MGDSRPTSTNHDDGRDHEANHTSDASVHEVLTVAEAACFLRLPRKTLYKLIDQGVVPHVRLTTSRIRLRRSSLVAWLASQESSSRRGRLR